MNDVIPEAPLMPIRSRGRGPVWLIPLAAMGFVIFLFTTHVLKRGPVVTLGFEHANGLGVGDPLRLRGTVVGEVESIRLNTGLNGVSVRVRLEPHAQNIARAGSRFWVVRPSVGLGGIVGLDTLTGARYLAVIPGAGEKQDTFVGLEEAPVIETMEAEGLELVLISDRRSGLRPGSMITYRQVVIGRVLSVNLASDAASVRVRLYIEPRYTSLVRENSVFWNTSGAEINLSLSGLRVQIESLQALLDGGISLATPDQPGDRVFDGHRFVLFPKVKEDWLSWRPALLVGTDLLPKGAVPPRLHRITVRQARAGLFGRSSERSGWALRDAHGLIAPETLLKTDGAAELILDGKPMTLDPETLQDLGDNLRGLKIAWTDAETPFRSRRMDRVEDCVILTDRSASLIPLASDRMGPDGRYWFVDRAMSMPVDLNGAAVIARSDGALVGVLSVNDLGQARLLMPPVTKTQE